MTRGNGHLQWSHGNAVRPLTGGTHCHSKQVGPGGRDTAGFSWDWSFTHGQWPGRPPLPTCVCLDGPPKAWETTRRGSATLCTQRPPVCHHRLHGRSLGWTARPGMHGQAAGRSVVPGEARRPRREAQGAHREFSFPEIPEGLRGLDARLLSPGTTPADEAVWGQGRGHQLQRASSTPACTPHTIQHPRPSSQHDCRSQGLALEAPHWTPYTRDFKSSRPPRGPVLFRQQQRDTDRPADRG